MIPLPQLRLFLFAACLAACSPLNASDYFPPRGEWQHSDPASAGFDAAKLAAAVQLAQAKGQMEPHDLGDAIRESYKREPGYRVLGPTGRREAPAGVIIRNGYIVAEWGDLERVEMTFSVVKSMLSSVAGLAWDRGLLPDLDQRAGQLVRSGHFDSEHNRAISWRHLLNQTSDWQGELWDTHDWADRPVGDNPALWPERELHPPGSHYKYNDVRVNLLAYALLQLWRQPLPVVLREQLMDPIGASPTWRWHGYENSWVELDGQRMQSVSGGGHFGGGMFISTLDMARFGLLFLRNGRWEDRQLLSAAWIKEALQATPVRPDYGFMWWLNTGGEALPAAPESAFYAAGYGGNTIYVDPASQLVVVLRWTPALSEVISAVLDALPAAQGPG
jgi:CubicO group peptidase (beta-lactamase class C family)